MLIPDSNGMLKQMKIPVGAIYIAVLLALIFLATNLFISAEFFTDKVSKAELAKLRAENNELKEKYEQLKWSLSEVEDRYSSLVDKEVKIRNLFNLPEIDPEERQLGVGGPLSPGLANLSLTEQTALSTEVEVERLLRLSKFELEKYNEVEEELSKIKKRLEHTPSIWPTQGWNSRGFGMKYDPFTGYKQMHRGIDIANRNGTPVIATADGVVKRARVSTGMGRFITIDHGYGFQTRYGHLSKFKVKEGQRVKRGEIIALMGSTGYSTGPHLHYEVIRSGKFFNPNEFILNDK